VRVTTGEDELMVSVGTQIASIVRP
jgi:hypothetical protein